MVVFPSLIPTVILFVIFVVDSFQIPTTSSLILMTTSWLPTTTPQTQSECSRPMELLSRIFPLLVMGVRWVSPWILREDYRH